MAGMGFPDRGVPGYDEPDLPTDEMLAGWREAADYDHEAEDTHDGDEWAATWGLDRAQRERRHREVYQVLVALDVCGYLSKPEPGAPFDGDGHPLGLVLTSYSDDEIWVIADEVLSTVDSTAVTRAMGQTTTPEGWWP